MMAILTGVKQYLIVVLICITLMATDAEPPLICLWVFCMSSMEKCVFRSFAHFLIGLSVFLEWSHMSLLYILEIRPLSEMSLAIYFPYYCFPFHFVDVLFNCAETFYFDEVSFVYSFLYVPSSRGHISENIAAWKI